MSRPTSGAYPRSRLSLSAQSKHSAGSLHLEELVFVDTFTHELPGDPLTAPNDTKRPASAPAEKGEKSAGAANNNPAAVVAPARSPRAVRGAFYSLVPPDTGCVHPLLIAASPSALSMLGLAKDEYRRREFSLYMSGATHIPRARPWSAAYGGHQFGCYSGQLGDGRCVTLGEIIAAPTPQSRRSARYEIQLKGAGLTPYSRFGDGLTTLAAAVREFVAAEFMHSVGIPTTRALAVVATQVPVYRGADPQPHAGAVLSRASSCWVRFGTFELFHYRHDKERVKLLADYVIKHHFQDVLQAEEDGDASGERDTTRWPVGTTAESRLGSAGINRQTANPSDTSADPVDRLKSNSEEKTDSDNDDDDEDDEEEDVVDELADKPPPQLNDRRGTRRLSFVFQSFPTPSADAMEAMEAAAAQAPTEATRSETVVVDVELNAYARFFQEVIRRTADLVACWQAIGFVHGEMNTDNMSILGLTTDYGSYGFLDGYDPYWTPNPADRTGRYRFERQAKIALWNLSKLGRTLAELIAPPPPPAATGNQPTRSLVAAHVVRGEEIVRELLKGFEDSFVESYSKLMCKKLGLQSVLPTDLSEIIDPLLQLLADAGADYTNFFRSLCTFDDPAEIDAKDTPTSLDILLRGVARLYVSDDDAGEEEDEEEPERAGTLAASMSGALGVTDREITKRRNNNDGNSSDEQDESDQDENQSEDDAPNNEALRKDSKRSNRSSTSSLRARFVIPDDGSGSSDSVSQMSGEITERWTEWSEAYRARLALEPPDTATSRLAAMRKANPRCIPRQHKLNDLARQVISRVPATGQAMRRSGMQGMDPDMERILRVVIQGGGDGSEEDAQCLREWCEEPPDTPLIPDEIPI